MGVTLIQKFHWVIYIMGGFLILTGIKMATQKDIDITPSNPVLRLVRRLVQVTGVTRAGGSLCGVAGDVRHAAVHRRAGGRDHGCDFRGRFHSCHSRDHARPIHRLHLECLRDLGASGSVFALAGVIRLFHYLPYGLSFILAFVGIKMLLVDIYKVPVSIALGTVAAVLAISVLASIIWPPKIEVNPAAPNPSRPTTPGLPSARDR